MNKITCPICQEEHEENKACPRCSFESHHTFSISKHFQEIEQKRIAAHSEWWQKILDSKVDKEKYEQKVEEFNQYIAELEKKIASKEEELNAVKRGTSRHKPIGFLVTDRQVVYCIYEGTNIFGSPSASEDESSSEGVCSQSMAFSGVQMLHEHFAIAAQKNERTGKMSFGIRRFSAIGTGVYLNSFTQEVGSESVELKSGDIIILSTDGNSVNVELRFRKNLTL